MTALTDTVPWWYRAECRKHPPEMWAVSGNLTADNRLALAICQRDCPVTAACLADATDNPPTSVIQGGMVWNSSGKPRKVPGRKPARPPAAHPQLAPVRPVGSRRNEPRYEEAARAIDLARRTLTAGGVLCRAAAAAGLTPSMVKRASVVVRRDPELAERVRTGDEVLTRAYDQVMARRVTAQRMAS